MGKRLNIELGQRGVNSGQKFSSRFSEVRVAVLHFYVFSDFPSSEVKYTGLESRGKGTEKFSAATFASRYKSLNRIYLRRLPLGTPANPKSKIANPKFRSGDDRDRTGNPCLAKAVLSQLSYVPRSRSQVSGISRLY